MKNAQTIKVKQPIRIRFKNLANGNKSIYLDCYFNGKRSYDFLKLYLIPEKSQADKTANENTLQVAHAVKAQKIVEFQNEQHGFKKNHSREKTNLYEYILAIEKGKAIKTQNVGKHLIHQMQIFHGKTLLFNEINKDFCLKFIEYLKTSKLAKNTQCTLVAKLNSTLNVAVENDILFENPLSKISVKSKPKKEESTRQFLTIDEIEKLKNTDCKMENVKNAFLFSCFCGLRLIDIEGLKWSDIIIKKSTLFIDRQQTKTKHKVTIPITETLKSFLPERGNANNNDLIFRLPARPTITSYLKEWGYKAIHKTITFHQARHSFATTLITYGADIYTTSKLLGHNSVKVTEVYAKLIDEKKIEAMAKLPKIL